MGEAAGVSALGGGGPPSTSGSNAHEDRRGVPHHPGPYPGGGKRNDGYSFPVIRERGRVVLHN